ncbi:MAG: glycosyltransferase family 39 protein [Pseudomonadota bacterium]
MFGLLSRSIWYDEAITLQSLAAAQFSMPNAGFTSVGALKEAFQGNAHPTKLIDHYVNADVHPPFYFLIANASVSLTGLSLTSARAVSLGLVLAAVFLYANMVRRENAGHLPFTLTVFGLSFAVATSAQDARSYALLVFLVVAAWMVLVETTRELTKWYRWVADVMLGAICGCLLLTHYFAIFVVLPIIILRCIRGPKRQTTSALLAPLVCTLVFLPWLPTFLTHLTARPEQMLDALDPLATAKWTAQLLGGLVWSTSHSAIPEVLNKAGRAAVIGLALIGVASIFLSNNQTPEQRRVGPLAVWIPAIGVSLFVAVSIWMDRRFDLLRYLIIFAPFMAYLAARGALQTGAALTALDSPLSNKAPVTVLIFAQLAMLNWGWEATQNRGGGYFNSIALEITTNGVSDSLTIVDPGNGRGNLLAAVYVLPPDAPMFVLPPDMGEWQDSAKSLHANLNRYQTVLLVYTIDRGRHGKDKSPIYETINAALQDQGFAMVTAPPAIQGALFYAKWVRQ